MNASAKSINDINLMSVFLQQSITSFAWMRYQKQSFYFLLNRKNVEYDQMRSNNILEVRNVTSATTKFETKNYFLYIISMICESNNKIVFSFSDGNFLKLAVTQLDVEMKCISHNW